MCAWHFGTVPSQNTSLLHHVSLSFPPHTPPPHAGPGGGPGSGASGVGGGGVGGGGRRIISDVPPHIQQLLEQQDRQAFERGSPSRRPVYRKIIGIPSSEGLSTAYIVPGLSAKSTSHP